MSPITSFNSNQLHRFFFLSFLVRGGKLGGRGGGGLGLRVELGVASTEANHHATVLTLQLQSTPRLKLGSISLCSSPWVQQGMKSFTSPRTPKFGLHNQLVSKHLGFIALLQSLLVKCYLWALFKWPNSKLGRPRCWDIHDSHFMPFSANSSTRNSYCKASSVDTKPLQEVHRDSS